MRTVEQVVSDLKTAQAEEAKAAAVTKRFREELTGIYNASKEALGIVDLFPR